jgi:uncharacterized RmlC-like cupin family protein
MSVPRPAIPPGRTRTCPHCKATILESAIVCPGCQHHLRFGSEAAARAAAPAVSAFRVEGRVEHPPGAEPWEYCVVISVRNERNEEVARQVVNVGALQGADVRTFTLSVDVFPPRTRKN